MSTPAPSPYDTYTSPLATRNASPEMLRLWSARHKFNTWRKIWLAVAGAQHELGLPVTKEQVEELRAVVNRPGGITDEEMKAAEKYERELRHDVMAHVHALGDSCPKAKGIIHLGMTSQDVVCNADVMTIHAALDIIYNKLTKTVCALGLFADRTKRIPTLAFTHYQPAQPVTVGRRAALWAHDLHFSQKLMGHCYGGAWTRGLRGATGTQASFEALLGKPHQSVALEHAFIDKLEAPAWEEPGHTWQTWSLTGQTYPRVFDAFVLSDLAATASVLHKIATDIRLLCNRKEMDEPFEDKQIGSSAMPYKRNPMRCERICGLARFVMNLVGNAYDTAATQWLERTLDDSSNRRLSLPEAFLALDGALDLMHNVASGLIVHEAMVRKNLMAELPFMATENLLMACVKLGADRQEYHEVIRRHAQAAGLRVKQEGLDNDLLDRLKNDKHFWSTSRGGALSAELDWDGLLDPMKYVGRSVEQTERFIRDVVEPLREQYGEQLAKMGETGPRV
jgi:adenylosuccinate lyase